MISESYAERIRKYIQEAEKNPDILNTQKLLPADYNAMGIAAQLFTKSLLMGLDSALQKKQFAEDFDIEDIENLPYEEAVEYLKKRSILTKDDYYNLSNKLRFRAFTVGRINDGRLLEKLNSEMIQNVNDGKGLKDFLSLTKTDILDRIGMGPNQGLYWETVYRTNVQTAYNVGRAMGFEEDQPIALEFVGIDDNRQTDTCASASGTIRPYKDPFWQTHTPPLHFKCRSTLRGIYDESELPAKWTSVADAEDAAKGFGSWPTENALWWEELASQTKAAKYYGVQGEIERAKELLFNNQIKSQGGSHGGILDKSNEEQEVYAKRAYEEIRNKNELFDIEKVSNSSGIKKEDIKKVRDHIFINKHLLNGEMKRFDESPEIALAWEALEQNRASDKDILLVKHELEELTIMENLGYNYDIAHLYANKKYPWEYKLKGGWTDDSIQADIERRLKLLL